MADLNRTIRPKAFLDGLGIFLSQLCLLHCLLLPVALALLPNLDFHSLPAAEALHFLILLLATPTAVYALLSGFKYHRRVLPPGLGGLGLALLWLSTALEHQHLLLSHSHAHYLGILGSGILISAHLSNRWHVKESGAPCDCGAN